MGQSTIDDGEIRGRHANDNCNWPVSAMEQYTRSFGVALTDCVVWDSGQTLPGTAAADDLEIDFGSGISATDSPTIGTGDVKATSSTRKMAFPIILPSWYEGAAALQIDFYAGMKTTIADGSCTLDLEVFKSDKDGTSNADICATAAQDINSLTHATFSFTITQTGLSAGDRLWGLTSIVYADTATVTAVIGQIGSIDITCTCRG